jgi:hypothetical protein
VLFTCGTDATILISTATYDEVSCFLVCIHHVRFFNRFSVFLNASTDMLARKGHFWFMKLVNFRSLLLESTLWVFDEEEGWRRARDVGVFIQ